MTATSTPTIWPRTIYRGTDHLWQCRRTTEDGTPIIPTSAKAQVRKSPRGALWVEPSIDIDPIEGWITLTIPKADTASDEWDGRTQGVWDLTVVVGGKTLRWAEGRVNVEQDVTQ